MRGILIFVLGAIAGQLVETNMSRDNGPGAIMLDHVGIAVDDMDESVAFYTETMGFEKTFSLASVEGEMGLMYLSVGENTFLELTPANEYVPAGLTHIGIRVEGIESVKDMYENRGVNPTEARRSSTEAILSYIYDPQRIPIELSEYPPDSAQGRALAGE